MYDSEADPGGKRAVIRVRCPAGLLQQISQSLTRQIDEALQAADDDSNAAAAAAGRSYLAAQDDW